jgi:ATP-dependent helicase/nuclease subunit B
LISSLAMVHWGPRAEVLSLADLAVDPTPEGVRTLQVCDDAADEAQRAAATVIERVNQGTAPVALVATDRLLTRRVSALLYGAGLAVRDETGWKLSTTSAAARPMALLRAADPRARTDDVIDLLKQGQAWPADQVAILEQLAREVGASAWRAVLRHPVLEARLPAGLAELLGTLQSARPLERWLDDLRTGLVGCGLWAPLLEDQAGLQLVQVLRLQEGAGAELRQVGHALSDDGRASPRLSLAAFTAWVRDVLEAASFLPPGDADASVVILPMAQLLGRGFAAVVLPGCDEATLDPNPEPSGPWTMAQRAALDLPGREQLARTAAGAWRVALSAPRVDLLWRRQDGGEALSPSPWVLGLPAQETMAAAATNALRARAVQPLPTPAPRPVAPALVPPTLSASAYQDLRDCPYRFFALRQLRLAEAAELEAEPDQRDLGNWLHAVLRRFHEQRADHRPGRAEDVRRLNGIGDAVALEMGLQTTDGEAGFMPYLAVWPALREGYLDWLHGYEGGPERRGPRFVQGEAERSAELAPWRLWGKLDRIDEQDSPEGRLPVVIDYKTESRQKTEQRIKNALEDTQLAFYAALLPNDNLRAGYLSITDGRSATSSRPATHLFEQPQVVAARDRLREALVHDLSRVANGHPLPALGEGVVCEHCAARGLCRKDFWSPA